MQRAGHRDGRAGADAERSPWETKRPPERRPASGARIAVGVGVLGIAVLVVGAVLAVVLIVPGFGRTTVRDTAYPAPGPTPATTELSPAAAAAALQDALDGATLAVGEAVIDGDPAYAPTVHEWGCEGGVQYTIAFSAWAGPDEAAAVGEIPSGDLALAERIAAQWQQRGWTVAEGSGEQQYSRAPAEGVLELWPTTSGVHVSGRTACIASGSSVPAPVPSPLEELHFDVGIDPARAELAALVDATLLSGGDGRWSADSVLEENPCADGLGTQFSFQGSITTGPTTFDPNLPVPTEPPAGDESVAVALETAWDRMGYPIVSANDVPLRADRAVGPRSSALNDIRLTQSPTGLSVAITSLCVADVPR